MGPLDFWLHMDEQYMWLWFCSRKNGELVAISADRFFELAEAEGALREARYALTKPAAA